METRNSERVALVTGATSGIGRAVAKRFAADSAHLIIIGRNQAALTEAEGEIKSAGGSCESLCLDVTAADEVTGTVEAAISRAGRLDVLVNAAGHISSG